MSDVYLVRCGCMEPPEQLDRKLRALWDTAGLDRLYESRDLVALKVHVGEPGTRTFTSPAVAATLVDCLKQTGCKPFLTDTSVLYRSPRDNAVEHALVAARHGYDLATTGAPFIPADGLIGADEVEFPFAGRIHDKIAIASAIVQARSMLVLTHATGHLGTGFGGALKNLGMGCTSKKAKLRQHHGQHPRIDPDACTACGTCAAWCPTEAIAVEETASIDATRCIGCGECIAACRDDAVRFDWTIMGRQLQERIAEHAAALVQRKPGRIGYVTVAQQITKDCDCLGLDQPPLLEDIGYLASTDPVAIDAAVLDLVEASAGQTLESLSYPRVDARIQIQYAEEMGAGSASYRLIEVQ